MLWVQTDTPSYHMAHQYGDAQIIEEAGGKIYHQTCMAMNPVRHYPQGITIATDSFKYVKLGGGFGMTWIFGNPPALVNAAVTGVFTPTARWDYLAKPRHERLASEKERPLYSSPSWIEQPSFLCAASGVARWPRYDRSGVATQCRVGELPAEPARRIPPEVMRPRSASLHCRPARERGIPCARRSLRAQRHLPTRRADPRPALSARSCRRADAAASSRALTSDGGASEGAARTQGQRRDRRVSAEARRTAAKRAVPRRRQSDASRRRRGKQRRALRPQSVAHSSLTSTRLQSQNFREGQAGRHLQHGASPGARYSGFSGSEVCRRIFAAHHGY